MLAGMGGGAGAVGALALALQWSIVWVSFFTLLAVLGFGFLAHAGLQELRRQRRQRQDLLPILRVSDPDSVYELGIDREDPVAKEQLAVADTSPSYIPRDSDDEISTKLRTAAADSKPRLVVVEGVSKAGKSRSLFEALRRDLPDAIVIAPKGAAGLEALLNASQPFPRRRLRRWLRTEWLRLPLIKDEAKQKAKAKREIAVVWLDDIERFF